MRPIRLELSGFASFREPVVLDFEDVDLFVLTGPTGAGKSSVIDAMTMCLYGSVPRYDDKRLVAPAISQGQLEARVRLDFAVGDVRYAAVRVIQRTKRGATTKEARLERDGHVLAGTADEVTAQVERLLGLGFEHFTRTVVLPQGDFHEFLHAKPGERQDLLVRLLDLDVYRQVASAARADEAAAKAAVEALRRRLDDELADATDAAVAAARDAATRLREVVAELDAARPDLEKLVERGREARQDVAQATEQRDAVAAIAPPDGLDELAERLSVATTNAAEAEAAVNTADEQLEQRRTARAEQPQTDLVNRVLEATETLDRAKQLVASQEPEVAAAVRAASEADEQHRAARVQHDVADAALTELRHAHAAHTLRSGVTVGDPCPVCHREVTEPLVSEAPTDVAKAEAAVTRARQVLADRDVAARKANEDVARVQAQLEAARSAIAEREEALAQLRTVASLPDTIEPLRSLATEVAALDRAIASAETVARKARTAAKRAKGALAALATERQKAWQAFDRARDDVATLKPPAPDRGDLGVAWRALVEWAQSTRPELERRAADAEQAIEAAIGAYNHGLQELRDRAAAAGVDAGAPAPNEDPFAHLRDACVNAATRAASRVERLEEQREQAAQVRDELTATERRAQLSGALGQHLNAKRFEKWLLNRALRRLVAGASEVLIELSSGAYSLALADDNNFLVIDHRNADAARSARTLSGGETFLASLSLALSLAEDIAALAAQGSARLEALFLDEGFGTLDADTLDIVAAAIEELGSRGRMVGLVTHVRELAERIPVRYEVRRDGTTSRVEKVTT